MYNKTVFNKMYYFILVCLFIYLIVDRIEEIEMCLKVKTENNSQRKEKMYTERKMEKRRQ